MYNRVILPNCLYGLFFGARGFFFFLIKLVMVCAVGGILAACEVPYGSYFDKDKNAVISR